MIDITQHINAWIAGEATGIDRNNELFELIYERLHDIARAHHSKGRQDNLFQTTALLNEAFLRLVHTPDLRFNDREHFFAYCSHAMRHVLVDLAKKSGRRKRGGGALHLGLDEVSISQGVVSMEDVVAVHEALESLASVDPGRAELVELRYFAGLSPSEIASVLNLSESTVHRRWRVARAWLFQHFQSAA